MNIGHLNEPELQFGDGTHVDVRAGIANSGTLDRSEGMVPVPVRVGIVGTAKTIQGVKAWIESCQEGVASKETRLCDLRPEFPGMTPAVFGTRLEVVATALRTITQSELTALLAGRPTMDAVVSMFFDHATDLAARGTLHVLVIAPPVEIFALSDPRPPAPDAPLDEGGDHKEPQVQMPSFHDVFKARALELAVPSQVIRPDTYGGGSTRKGGRRVASLQDDATRAWNFHTAMYYKAGGVPWRLVRDSTALSSCYVGVSFFKSADGEHLLTSVAQVFNERGEGVIVQGGNARIDKDDRSGWISRLGIKQPSLRRSSA